MTFKSFSYWCCFAALTLLALILANTPLLNLLAFEFCAVLAFAISFAGAHTAVTGVGNLRQRTQLMRGTAAQMVMSTFWRAFWNQPDITCSTVNHHFIECLPR